MDQTTKTPLATPTETPITQTQKESTLNSVQPEKKSYLVLGIALVVGGLAVGILGGWALTSFTSNQQITTTSANQSQESTLSGDPFVIGMIVPLTGDGASYGTNAKEIALMTEKELNNKDGIGGRPIKFIFEDGQCMGDNAKNSATKLINEDKVDLLYAGECSDEVLAAAPIAQEKKIISISTGATNPKVSELGKYVFRTALSDEVGGRVAAKYALDKMNSKTAAIIVENTSYALGLRDVFNEEFTKLGGKVLYSTVFETGETDFVTTAEAVAKANPDLVYIIPQTPIPGVLAIKAIREKQPKVAFLTAEVLLARDEIEKHGKILEGLIGMEAYFDAESEGYKQLKDKFVKEYGRDVAYPTDLVEIHDFIYLYKAAYESVGSNDTDKISEYMYSLKDWKGTASNLTFNKQGDIISKKYGIYKITNNTANLIETYATQ